MSAWRLALRRGVLIRLRSPKDLRGVGADGCALPPDHCTGRHEGAGHHFDERGHAPPFPRCASHPTLLSCGPLAPDLMAPGRREAGAKGGGGGCSGYWSRLGLLLHVRGARSAPAGRGWSSLSLSAPALSERVGRSRLEGGGGEGGRGGGACRRLRRASDLPRAACWRARTSTRAQRRDFSFVAHDSPTSRTCFSLAAALPPPSSTHALLPHSPRPRLPLPFPRPLPLMPCSRLKHDEGTD